MTCKYPLLDDIYHLYLRTTGKPKGHKLPSFTNPGYFDYELQRQRCPQMLAQITVFFDLSVMYWAPTYSWRVISSISAHWTLKQLADDLFLRLLSGLQHHLLQIWPCCSMLKNARISWLTLIVKNRSGNCASVSQMHASSRLRHQKPGQP